MARRDVTGNQREAQKILGDLRRTLLGVRGSWRQIERATGVPRHWIANVVHGRIKEPGFVKALAVARHIGLLRRATTKK